MVVSCIDFSQIYIKCEKGLPFFYGIIVLCPLISFEMKVDMISFVEKYE